MTTTPPLRAAYIDNGIHGLADAFPNQSYIEYTALPVGADFRPDLDPYDLLVVPNGSDHVAMFAIRDAVRGFLERGGALFCFDGWFTDWVPGHTWICDTQKPTREVRYLVDHAPEGLMDDVNLDDLIFMNGISGWWACGYIDPAPSAQVVLRDTWNRAVVVWDDRSTQGTLFLTASGPLGHYREYGGANGLTALYENALRLLARSRVPA
ncbi:hypothetical protein SCOR_23365 [Sulfidibacter corallicola]|uniref:Glutamine amidotransferase domain-containing protein n=1 Tax=Sulfidibacter corallicola TaxID=2818388 RepID=A0A8A4TRP4_SULCO|nr:hypothetical protein [Sulfidibacter corallicola]QTD52649.1 hypothetical protein J3U87_09255 [Sulfidibacter corallicola]